MIGPKVIAGPGTQEMTEHLGHDKHATPGNESGNVRNGTRAKTVLAEGSGQVGIEVPRDQAATFEPQIVRKRQRRLSGVDEMVLSLYAKSATGVARHRPGERETIGSVATRALTEDSVEMEFLTDDPVAQAVTYQRVTFDARAPRCGRCGCATAGRVSWT